MNQYINSKIMALLFIISLFFTSRFIAQSIEIVSYGENPLEVSPLLGVTVAINYKYTSESGSSGNHIYIGINVLDENDNWFATISGATLENQNPGSDIEGSVTLFVGSSNQLSESLPMGYSYQVAAVLYASGGWSENAWAGHWNTAELLLQDTIGYTFNTNKIAKGADISSMTEMESNGATWKDNDGNTKELMPLLKEYGLDAVRLRLWVNPENSPANGWCDIEDVVTKAELAAAMNMDIMLCVHYSDHWADPGKQTKPAAWAGFSVTELETAVAEHTTAILTALSAKGITPKWVQIGNETNDGMLWSKGKASQGGFANYAKFVNAGMNAVKNFNSAIKTILHLANGDDSGITWNIDGLINNGLNAMKLDVIGLSLYTEANNWKTKVDDAYNNMLDLKSLYNKEVMLVEVGFNAHQPSMSYQFLTYVIEKTKQAEGIGVFYWEPTRTISKGAWDADGSPSLAMDAFKNNETLNVSTIVSNPEKEEIIIYPNPVKTLLKTNLNNNDAIKSIQITNLVGKIIRTIYNAQSMKTINLSDLANGLYILKTNTNKRFKFLKI
jgi:arabinogalactan endo-1,4-beta-galactosidase